MKINQQQFEEDGFEIINHVFSEKEIQAINHFLKTKNIKEVFGMRSFLKTFPEITSLVFNQNIVSIINSIEKESKVIKSIYFNKPPSANWIVNWHQDLTINVSGKSSDKAFKNWRFLKERTIVQPPLEILENIFTIRIHLDHCTQQNGALQVISKSHQNGVINLSNKIAQLNQAKKICEVKKGGILVMKPLLFHSSKRTENHQNRRVIHIEFSNKNLPNGMKWLEAQDFSYQNSF